jgi:hypothetical protein
MNSRALIETAVKQGLSNFIFSSTAAVYGNPTRVPVREDDPTGPTSPGHDQHRFCPKKQRLTELHCPHARGCCGAADHARLDSHFGDDALGPIVQKPIVQKMRVVGNPFRA